MGNAVSSLPYGAQSSQLQTTLQCDVPEGAETFVLFDSFISLSTTTALYGGAGQQISFSDLAGSTQLPFNATDATVSGASGYSVNISLAFDVTNAAPSTLSYSQVSTGSWDDRPVSIPANGGVAPPLGPVTLGAEGQISDFQISTVSFSVLLRDSSGNSLPGRSEPVATTCRPIKRAPISVGFQAVISSTVIDNSTGPAQAPALGVPGSFPATTDSVKSVKANIPILCTQRNNISPSNAYNLTIEATAPSALINGQSFNLSNVDSFVTVPGDLLALLSQFWGGTTAAGFVDLGQAFSGAGITGPGLGAVLENATPSTFDLAKDFTVATEPSTPRPLFTGRYYPVGDNKPIVFPLPQFGSLTFADLQAGDIGNSFSLTVPRLQAIVSVSSERGQLAGAEKIDCRTTHPFSLLRAPILPA